LQGTGVSGTSDFVWNAVEIVEIKVAADTPLLYFLARLMRGDALNKISSDLSSVGKSFI
jgi:hypothetical protein